VGRGKIGQPGTPWRRSSDLRLARTGYGRKQLLFVERRRILLVAVQPLFRVGLALPIEWRKGFEIMQAGSLTETRQILGDLHDTLDLAIVDLASLEASGASVIASICEAEPNARIRYSTIQNWSHNTYNLVTKRAVAEENATVEWVDGNLGSKLTMKYPAVYLMGEGARGEILSVAYAGNGQHQDAGGKVVHAAPNTSSRITSKSISKGTGRSTYRGLLKVHEGAQGSKSRVECDALLLDEKARTDTYPYIEIEEKKVTTEHEATVSKVGEDQLFYLMSRGLSEEEAMAMVVNGFIEPIAKELPLEYAIELNRLIQLEMEGSVG
jgi:Fe-S cluster assembly scaffold protein SufB